MGISLVFQVSFKGVWFRNCVDAWQSSQLPEQKDGLLYLGSAIKIVKHG